LPSRGYRALKPDRNVSAYEGQTGSAAPFLWLGTNYSTLKVTFYPLEVGAMSRNVNKNGIRRLDAVIERMTQPDTQPVRPDNNSGPMTSPLETFAHLPLQQPKPKRKRRSWYERMEWAMRHVR
jgi:hypothetical protein